MLYETYFIKHYYLSFKEKIIFIMSQNWHTSTTHTGCIYVHNTQVLLELWVVGIEIVIYRESCYCFRDILRVYDKLLS